MADDATHVLSSAQLGFAVQDAATAAARERQLRVTQVRRATGTGNVNLTFSLDQRFRLVYVRGHFSGGSGAAPLVIALDSGAGSAYDAALFTLVAAGTGSDVNFRLSADELCEPSAWVFQQGDAIRVTWTNPASGTMIWGLEVGLALAT